MRKILASLGLFILIPAMVFASPNIVPVNIAGANLSQIGGNNTSTGNGTTDSGTLRVTISSDSTGQVKLATGVNTIGALTANQSVNVAQVGGGTVATAATGIAKVGLTDASGNAINSTSNALNVAVVSGGGTGGTSSNFGSAFPTPGTAVGASDGVNMQPFLVDGSGFLKVNVAAGGGAGGTSAADNAAFTAGSTSGTPAMGFYHSTVDTVTDAHTAALAIDSKRNLFNVIRDAAGNARGANVNASNQLSVSVDNNPVIGAGTNVIGHVIADSGSTTAVTGNVAATVADGADVTLGAKADAKSTATDTTAITVMQVLKEISAMEQAPASRAVTNAGTFATQATLQTGTNQIGHLEANQSSNVAQINGVAPLMGAGNTGTGSLRVTLATDQAQLTNKLLVTPDANSSVNVAQINGVTNAANPCTYIVPTTVAVSQTASAKLISQTSAKTNYICGGTLVAGAAEVVNIVEGTGTVCATNTVAVAGSTTAANGISLAANGGFVVAQPITGTGTNLDLCLSQSGSSRVSGYITYVQK